MPWEFWVSVIVVGLVASGLRVLRQRLRARGRVDPETPQRLACALGVPEGERLAVWVGRGASLPLQQRRMMRVPSAARELRLGLHSDAPSLEPVAEVLVGPLDLGERAVRLVEIDLFVDAGGGLKIRAREKSTGTPIKVTWLQPVGAAARRLRLPTEDDPDADIDGIETLR